MGEMDGSRTMELPGLEGRSKHQQGNRGRVFPGHEKEGKSREGGWLAADGITHWECEMNSKSRCLNLARIH